MTMHKIYTDTLEYVKKYVPEDIQKAAIEQSRRKNIEDVIQDIITCKTPSSVLMDIYTLAGEVYNAKRTCTLISDLKDLDRSWMNYFAVEILRWGKKTLTKELRSFLESRSLFEKYNSYRVNDYRYAYTDYSFEEYVKLPKAFKAIFSNRIFIMDSFEFSQTEEGLEFWLKVQDEWFRHIRKN